MAYAATSEARTAGSAKDSGGVFATVGKANLLPRPHEWVSHCYPPRSIEGLAGYNEQVACDPKVRPGTAKRARLLMATYPSAHASWASTYACGTDGTCSEHSEGRVIDWMVNVRNKAQHTAARSVLSWLLATDSAGNTNAMAQRLGVIYVIFDNRMWGGWSGRWQDDNGCAKRTSRGDDNACHRTHMHISLSWNGAMGTASFWTKKVAPTNYGPRRYTGMK